MLSHSFHRALVTIFGALTPDGNPIGVSPADHPQIGAETICGDNPCAARFLYPQARSPRGQMDNRPHHPSCRGSAAIAHDPSSEPAQARMPVAM